MSKNMVWTPPGVHFIQKIGNPARTGLFKIDWTGYVSSVSKVMSNNIFFHLLKRKKKSEVVFFQDFTRCHQDLYC